MSLKEKLLSKLHKQENFKELFVNTVLQKEEKNNAERNLFIEKTVKEKIDKEKYYQELDAQMKNKVNNPNRKVKQNHINLLTKQINDRKQNLEDKNELKKQQKFIIDKNVIFI